MSDQPNDTDKWLNADQPETWHNPPAEPETRKAEAKKAEPEDKPKK